MLTVLETLTVSRSGSLGDTVHSHNGSGPYTRPRTVPNDPVTFRQTRVRARLRVVSRFWANNLTPAERQSWTDLATRLVFPNKIRSAQTFNGQTLFIRNNAGRPLTGFNIIRQAPTAASNGIYTLPELNDLGGLGTVIVTINTADAWVTEDNAFLAVYVSDRRIPTINFFKGPFRFAGAVAGSSTAPPGAINPFDDPWGSAPKDRRTARTRVAFADGRLTKATLRRFRDST